MYKDCFLDALRPPTLSLIFMCIITLKGIANLVKS